MSERRGTLMIVSFLAVALTALAISAQTAAPLGPGHPAYGPKTGCAVKFDVSPPLRDIPPVPYPEKEEAIREVPNREPAFLSYGKEHLGVDPVVQSWRGEGSMPAPVVNFEGIRNFNGVLPPDTQGDVGPNHYVQWVNLSMAVYDKQGNLKWGPYNGNTVWSGFGGPCDNCNDGDPIVLYDRLADRWLISQFALPNYPSGPFYEYIAISQTGDPTGAWYRYGFEVSTDKMNDYPHLGVWPDGYYMTVNEFYPSSYAGVGAYVFDRAKMLRGDPTAGFQFFDLGDVDMSWYGMQPSHMEGSTAPPAGEPNTFIEFWDSAWGGYPTDRLLVWKFHVDWTTPSASTFGINGNPNLMLDTSTFDSSMCNGSRQCIPQPGTAAKIDAISSKLMYRVQYRNFPSYKTLVLNHTVDVDGTNHAGVRWYELRDSGSGWSVYQQGTYAPDGDNRWMGSAAMDKAGDIALGYSISSSSTYPGIRYAGRTPADPLGTLGQAEQTLMAGSGSQTHSAARWGDYSAMSIDPADDCTFWYTQEYYQTTSSAGWQTRVGAFKFPGCAFSSAVTANPTTGPYPLAVNFSASVTGGVSPYTYAWTFGDGASGTGATTSHTYAHAGTFSATVVASDNSGLSSTSAVSITVTVAPPVITSVQKLTNPFRLKVTGSNFHSGCTMTINGTSVPVTYKGSSSLIVKGSTVKALVPKGVAVSIVVTNPDDGGVSATYTYTR